MSSFTRLKQLCDLSGHDLCWRIARLCNLVFVVVGFVLLGYWGLDRELPIEILDTGSIHPAEAKPGEVVQVSWIIRKYKICEGESIRLLSGSCGAHILRVGQPAGVLALVPQVTNINFVVPELATPGDCYYHTTIRYSCNPVQKLFPVVQTFPIVKFKVVKP